MDGFWLETLEALSPEVAVFTSRFPESPAVDFQVRWDVLGSIAYRGLKGRLRHLPSKESIAFRVKLP